MKEDNKVNNVEFPKPPENTLGQGDDNQVE